MKKTFIILSCAFSLLFVSCASNEIQENQKEDFTQTEHSNETESENQTESESVTSQENDDLIEENSFPELEEITEPEIITLEPPLLEETSLKEENSNVTTTEEKPLEAELVVEIIPELEKNTKSEQTLSQVTEKNTESNKENNKNIQNVDESIDITNDDIALALQDESTDETSDITNEEQNSQSQENENQLTEQIIPSRKISLKKGEYLDVVYPGNGWIFMGLTDGSKDLSYFGRKLGTGQTKFTLQAKKSGTKIIHFYKEDNLTQQILDDYIEVEVLNENGSSKNHILAPEYKLPLTAKAKEIIEKSQKSDAREIEENVVESEVANENQITTTPQTKVTSENKITTTQKKTNVGNQITTTQTQSASENKITTTPDITPAPTTETTETTTDVTQTADPLVLLKEAQVLYNEKEYSEAKKRLDRFFDVAESKVDEGLYLKGQILEAKSKIQDIKGAIEAYTTLTKNYPASKYWDDASKRIIYLKRFYLEVR